MTARFVGRTAIVTGASRGIGLAVAQRPVDEGAQVVITARTKDALDEAVEQLGGAEHALAVAGKADDPDHQDEVSRAYPLKRLGEPADIGVVGRVPALAGRGLDHRSHGGCRRRREHGRRRGVTS